MAERTADPALIKRAHEVATAHVRWALAQGMTPSSIAKTVGFSSDVRTIGEAMNVIARTWIALPMSVRGRPRTFVFGGRRRVPIAPEDDLDREIAQKRRELELLEHAAELRPLKEGR